MSNTNDIKARQEQLREYCSCGDTTRAYHLIASGVNVNAQNPVNGWTALHCAVKRDQLEAIQLLLEFGADKRIVNNANDKQTPGDLTGNPDVLDLLGNNMIMEGKVHEQRSRTGPVPKYLTNPPSVFEHQHQQLQLQQEQE
ncbi:ankyrin repeat domain-containing protein 40-like [Ciona intestinalis]